MFSFLAAVSESPDQPTLAPQVFSVSVLLCVSSVVGVEVPGAGVCLCGTHTHPEALGLNMVKTSVTRISTPPLNTPLAFPCWKCFIFLPGEEVNTPSCENF